MAGLGTNSKKQEHYYEKARYSRRAIQDKYEHIQKLQDEISALKLFHGEAVYALKDSVKKAEDWAVAVEIQSGLLGKEVEGLKSELSIRKSEKDVIASFKASKEYEEELADAAALKILRCWLVTERHIKTDLDLSWDKFVELYATVEEILEKDGGEPEPYSGPNPIISQIDSNNPGDLD